MPIIFVMGAVKILMYFEDHNPPHIHAEYNEFEELIVIESLETLRGYLPNKQKRLVVDWMANHKDMLMKYWDKFNKKNN